MTTPLSQLGEFGLIRRLAERLPKPGAQASAGGHVLLGIGDDAAVLRPSQGRALLVTVDALIEGVHFRLDLTSLQDLGWKCLAVNVSDVAAMGGEPTAAFITLGLRKDQTVEDVEWLYDGLAEMAAACGVTIAGGDTVSSPAAMMVSVALLGEAEPGRIAQRQDARPGDAILVTGTLGDSAAGLQLLLAGERPDDAGRCIQAHLRPQPRLREARAAVATGAVHAMIDVSDGLAGDLRHVAEDSRTGALLWERAIPLSTQCQAASKRLNLKPLDLALHGGEDYELLLTCNPADAGRIRQAVLTATGTPVAEIGRITAAGLEIEDAGGRRPLAAKGWEHF